MHYQRWQRHGHTNQTRPATWGQKSKHPLWHVWKQTKRVGRDPTWNDFWTFVAEVGERPDSRHRLKRYDKSLPCGPDNWYWDEGIGLTEDTLAARAKYAREWRKKNPLRAKEHDLRKRGLTLTKYEALLTKQNGLCAICKQKDQHFGLAVDHCHDTGEIRGLLCSQCNRGLGLFRDDPGRLQAAIHYLTN